MNRKCLRYCQKDAWHTLFSISDFPQLTAGLCWIVKFGVLYLILHIYTYTTSLICSKICIFKICYFNLAYFLLKSGSLIKLLFYSLYHYYSDVRATFITDYTETNLGLLPGLPTSGFVAKNTQQWGVVNQV